jgi:hypothetical protein
MSKIEVNAIEPQCGTNLTVGASGDTITFPSGTTVVNNGTQTGFGRTGTVDWDTTAKTASFTAVSGTGYFVNTTSGAVTVTLPATPSAGDIVYVKDYTGTFLTNACTVARNGSNIRGAASDFDLEKNNSGGVFIYVDATEGWQVFVDGSDADVQQTYICATGGTETTCGDYKIHTFTGPGTFSVNGLGCAGLNDTVDYLVVAGGGGGAYNRGGGGGAGGLRDCTSAGFSVTVQGYPITVGGGGSGPSPYPAPNADLEGNPGSNSVFNSITSTGGGGGGHYCGGLTGGSGGGGGTSSPPQLPFINSYLGGAGNTPPVSPPQGNTGGTATPAGSPTGGGGGGGATAVGTNAQRTPGVAGSGGAGKDLSGTFGTSSGECGVFAGGGGAGGGNPGTGYTPGSGGTGGGGPGGGDGAGTAGTTNTGGGGGAGQAGGAGGSGIVIIRYKFQN